MNNVDSELDGDLGHSLPNAEEVKTEAALLGNAQKRRNRLAIILIGSVLVLALVIGLAVGLGGGGGGQGASAAQTTGGGGSTQTTGGGGGGGSTQTGGNDPPQTGGTPQNDDPTVDTDPNRDPPPGPQDPPPAEDPVDTDPTRFEAVVHFLRHVSEHGSLVSGTQPQNAVATWMAETDFLQLDVPSSVDAPDAYKFVQRYVLALLYRAMDGHHWPFKAKFMSSADECDWNMGFGTGSEFFRLGVTCNDDGQVVKILLPGNELKGTLPDELGYLTTLTHLSLYSNDIEGPFPDLGDLVDMEFMAIESNSLTGVVPAWFGNMTSLIYLALGDNQLSGELPEEIADMSRLEEVALDWNMLTGSMDVFSNLAALRRLYLGHNEFTGEMDDSFLAGSSNLVELDLASNNFTGTFPAHFLNANTLEIIDLHSNSLSGTFPDQLERNDKLQFLALYDNDLEQTIPDAITKLEAVTHLDVSDNALSGPLPNALGLMTTLTYLFVANNDFDQGPIPDLSFLTNLRELSLKGTKRTGGIPPSLGSLTELVLLDLDNNQLVGAIPDQLGNLGLLRFLLLNRNALTGIVPLTFTGLDNIDLVLMYNNSLSGNAAPLCGPAGPDGPNIFVMDCGTGGGVTCECCSKCCDKPGDNCYDDQDLLANVDSSWETGFRRDAYLFREDIVFRSNA